MGRASIAWAALLVFAAGCGSANAQTQLQSEATPTDEVPPPAAGPGAASAPPAGVRPAAQPQPPPVAITNQGLPRPPMPAHLKAYPFPVATLPGFEMLPGGGSRLFVDVTRAVNVEERRSPRVLTYVLKGAHVVIRNNENALVTIHFNTPVTRARLLPQGRDLVFTVDLRADASPSWKMVGGGDGTATLQIDFPPGTFLPPDGVVNEAAYEAAWRADRQAPAAAKQRWHKVESPPAAAQDQAPPAEPPATPGGSPSPN